MKSFRYPAAAQLNTSSGKPPDRHNATNGFVAILRMFMDETMHTSRLRVAL